MIKKLLFYPSNKSVCLLRHKREFKNFGVGLKCWVFILLNARPITETYKLTQTSELNGWKVPLHIYMYMYNFIFVLTQLHIDRAISKQMQYTFCYFCWFVIVNIDLTILQIIFCEVDCRLFYINSVKCSLIDYGLDKTWQI